VYFVGIIAISLHRETRRIENNEYFTKYGKYPISNSVKRPKMTQACIPIITLLLIAVFIGYLTFTLGTIYYSSAADPPAFNSVTVTIEETPITWQYSPQNIVVVIGVNNTVTWVSHSLSEDTITSDTGLFNSGVLHPGQVWSHTFASPGTYEYSCAFHPWMKGTVTVVAE
jgi:plastocyanin